MLADQCLGGSAGVQITSCIEVQIAEHGGYDVTNSGKPLHIDVPVKLAQVKVVFSIAALAFEGDLPASLFHIQVIENDIADWGAKSEIIAVFHTNAGHATLHDSAYNTT